MKALDLFCGAGGVSMGLHRAGFDVTGVDIKPQPRYPFKFIQADAMTFPLEGFDFIWASPPCQHYTSMNNRFKHDGRKHPDLVDAVREKLTATGKPYVIENVYGAPLQRGALLLCGSMFGLNLGERGYLRRHRYFESNFFIWQPECQHEGKGRALGVGGHGANNWEGGGIMLAADDAREIMQVPWMTRDGAAQAIPPAYAEFIATAFFATRSN